MIAIKGMEIPKCCHWDCPLCNEDGGACVLGAYDTKTDTKKKRAKDCPLVEDVIEREKIDKAIEEIKDNTFEHIIFEGGYDNEDVIRPKETTEVIRLDTLLEILKEI